jgi:hypothetical protein
MEKTHYRKVFKSDHLGVADLEEFLEEGKRLVFTIKEVKQEYNVSVAGKKGNFNIAYFKENIKPLVLNATNSKIVKSFNNNSPFVEDWNNTLIELYIQQNVRLGKETVEGVRIKPTQPTASKSKLTPDSDKWVKAVEHYKSTKNLNAIKKHYDLDKKDEELLIKKANG